MKLNRTMRSIIETEQVLVSASGKDKPTLPVPLSAVRLDIPFDEAETVKQPELAENIEVKSSPKAAKVVSTDQATAGLTLPLKLKLWLIFGGFMTLFGVVGVTVGLIFWRLATINQATVDQQVRADRTHQLHVAFVGQQGAVQRLLLQKQMNLDKPLNSFEFAYYSITFENNIFLIKQEPNLFPISLILKDIQERHFNLLNKFSLLLDDLEAKAVDRAMTRWAENEPYVEDLTARLISFAERETQLAEQQKRILEQGQTESLIWLVVTASAGVSLLGMLIWLANRSVIIPMGRLNVKLGQLLYSQTTRITDRLNLLEHEIDSQVQKLNAARHDLKLPLSNIRNSAELTLICEPDLTAEAGQNLKEIIETSDTSANLINSLLARSDNRLYLQETALPDLFWRVIELVDLRDYTVNTRIELAKAVFDQELIEHVLLNLLSNARKFSAGGIAIGARLVPFQAGKDPLQDRGEAEVELWVWNDGPVILPHERNIIFRAGVQTDIGRRSGGHGLGLAIVKSLVERHNGRVVVESHEKVGTTFRVFLPNLPKPLLNDE
jgi:signal transduction histidine kinase